MVDVMKLQSFQTVHDVDWNISISIAPKISARIADCEDKFSAKQQDGVKFYKKLEDNMWYHEKITRIEAESRVLYNGHFLVRDCISNPGNYVLTCDWDGRPVHFMINRVRLNPETKTSNDFGYQFEEDIFDSVPTLVEAYFDSKRPITRDSMCLITFPVNRPPSSPDINNNVKTYAGQFREKELSEILVNDGGTIAVIDNGQNVACSINSHKKLMKRECHSSSSSPPYSSSTDRPCYMPFSGLTKELHNDGRPLPPLPYAVKFRDQAAGSRADRDSGIGHSGRIPENSDFDDDYHEYCDIDYEEPKLPPRVVFRTAPPQIVGRKSETVNGRPGLPPRRPADIFLRDSACVADVSLYDTPKMKPPRLSFNFQSRIDRSESFDHPALPANELFSTTTFHRKIVDEILKIDAQGFVDILNESDRHFLGFCSEIDHNNMHLSHFDLILLPVGRQLRSDVLERSKLWTRFLVYCLTEILSSDKVRWVNFLAKWINIAKIAESQNWYAYGYILAALESKEVLSLTQCWQEFRVVHTDLALTYETQLKPKLLENQRNTVSHCSTCNVPDVEPIARLLNAETKLDTWLYQWEDLDPLFGIEAFWSRLRSFRRLQDSNFYKKNVSMGYCSICRKDQGTFASLIVSSQFHLKFLFESSVPD